MKHPILKGKKLTEYQKKALHVISDANEKNYILEVWEMNTLKSTYTITDGDNDLEDIRSSTMKKLLQFDFIKTKKLPSSFEIIRTKYYIPEKFKAQVFSACI